MALTYGQRKPDIMNHHHIFHCIRFTYILTKTELKIGSRYRGTAMWLVLGS